MSPDALKREEAFFPTETRWRLAVFFAILVAFSSVVYARIMVTLYRNASEENLRAFSEKQVLQTRFAANVLDARLYAVVHECEILSSYTIPYFVERRGSFEDLRNRMNISGRTHPGVSSLLYVGLAGDSLHICDSTRRGERLTEIARERIAMYGGRNMLPGQPVPFVPPVFASADTQFIVMLFPVFSDAGLLGTLAAVFDLHDTIDDVISAMRFGAYGTAFLTDGYGTVLYHPLPDLIGRNVFSGSFIEDEDYLTFNRRQLTEKQGTGSYKAVIRRGEAGESLSRKIAAWNSVRLGNVSLTVTMSTFVEEIEAPMRTMRIRLQLTGTLFILLLLTMSFLFFRRMSDHRIRENEIRLRLSMEAAGDSFWDWNVRTGKVFFSENFGPMFGFAPGEIKPDFDAWLGRVHPDDLPVVKDALRLHFADGSLFVSEYRVRNARGRWQWVLARGEVVERDRKGNPVRMIGTNSDVDGRRKMEEELRDKSRELELYSVRQRVLFRTFSQFGRCTDSAELYAIIEESLREVFDYRGLLLVIRSSRRGESFDVYDSGKRSEAYAQENFLREGLGIVGRAFREKRIERVGDVANDPDYVPHDPDIRSMLVVPVSSRDFSWGIVALDSEREDAFGVRDEELLSIVASYIALHLDERDARDLLGRKAVQLQLLHELVQLVMTERSNEDMARDVTTALVKDFGFRYASMLPAASGRDAAPTEAGRAETPDRSLRMEAFDSRSEATRANANGERTGVAIPVALGEQFYGVLSVARDEGMSDDDIRLFVLLADHISGFWALNEFILARQKEAWEDPLTGVWNRRYMIRKLEEEDRRMNRYGGRAGVAIVDLGNFKRVNDLLGHAAGDDVLVSVARILLKTLRDTDFVGRYGGDEFIVCFPDSTLHQCRTGLERAAKAVSELAIPGDADFRVFADYGVACRPEDGGSLMALVNIADERMYAFKNARKRENGLSDDDSKR
jgi:diguanylate cyclase (GGDEF)-like protein/PAS domain S-box-containing protein